LLVTSSQFFASKPFQVPGIVQLVELGKDTAVKEGDVFRVTKVEDGDVFKVTKVEDGDVLRVTAVNDGDVGNVTNVLDIIHP
jgi:uncharacterized Zn finger protein